MSSGHNLPLIRWQRLQEILIELTNSLSYLKPLSGRYDEWERFVGLCRAVLCTPQCNNDNEIFVTLKHMVAYVLRQECWEDVVFCNRHQLSDFLIINFFAYKYSNRSISPFLMRLFHDPYAFDAEYSLITQFEIAMLCQELGLESGISRSEVLSKLDESAPLWQWHPQVVANYLRLVQAFGLNLHHLPVARLRRMQKDCLVLLGEATRIGIADRIVMLLFASVVLGIYSDAIQKAALSRIESMAVKGVLFETVHQFRAGELAALLLLALERISRDT